MKKLGLTLMILLFTGMGIVNAQQPQMNNRPMQQNFRQNVIPVVKAEQAKLIGALTSGEKKELANIKEEMKTFRAQGKQISGSMKGNFNQQLWDTRRAAFDAIKVKADKLVAAHPKAAQAYREAIEKVEPQRPQGRPGMGRMQNQRPNRQFMRLSDPAFGLLMDVDQLGTNARGMRPMQGQRSMNPRQGMRGQQGMRGRQGMRGQQSGMRGQRMMNRQGRMQAGLRAWRNPEVRAKIEAYAKENIFPVLSKERTAFDANLSNKEKKQITAAREQLEARRVMMQKRLQNPNFVSGQRLNDSSRMAMRLEMQKNMLPVREIALKHYTELQTVLSQLEGQTRQWRADIRGLVNPGNQGMRPMQNKMAVNKRMHRNRGLLFLMYNPKNPQLPFIK